MGSYISTTKEQQQDMLREIGYEDYDALFSGIPEGLRLKGELKMPAGRSELEVRRLLEAMASQNTVFPHIFRGAGAYDHYIPAIVKEVTSKEEFLTAYTPYQAEISQGGLQSIFEYQTMVCELTGLDASNASVYDGATAAAEGVLMCCDRKRTKVLVGAAVNPQTMAVITTYCHGRGICVEVVPEEDGSMDLGALRQMMDEHTACLYLQQPNYYGVIEDAADCAAQAHDLGVKLVMGCNPISLAVLETPGECGADVAVGEGQPLGMPLSFGGPYLGFMAAARDMMRRLPGRIVGETVDTDGKRGYVLTLQAREQHIRREKAGSNICSNEALCALTASVYLAAMGPDGLKQAAVQSMSKAHYLQKRLEEAGLAPVYGGKGYFHEFVTFCPVKPEVLLSHLEERGYLGGLPIDGGRLLWCATEMNTRDEIEELAGLVKEVCG